ncbi:hypothetical protein SAMN05518856_108175 [Paenibacillus sp. OK003]|nr:hypothetical protein SAMN05518856_108175 [Paenibacillus sp. OK003]
MGTASYLLSVNRTKKINSFNRRETSILELTMNRSSTYIYAYNHAKKTVSRRKQPDMAKHFLSFNLGSQNHCTTRLITHRIRFKCDRDRVVVVSRV